MNLAWLEAFIVIVEEKSITKAAEKLHISQPALSKQLKNLETEFSTSLVTRSAQGIAVTKTGSHLFERAKTLIHQSDLIKRELQGLNGSKKLTIGCLPSIATSYLPKFKLSDHCVFIQNYSEALTDSLINGQIDIALIDDSFCVKGFAKKKLFSENYVAIVPKKYKLKQLEILTWRNVQDYPMILHASPCDSYSRITSYVQKNQYDIKIIREVPFGDFLYGYVLSGEGMTIVPKLIAQNLQHLDVDRIPVQELTRTISVVAKEKKKLESFLTSADIQ